MNDSTQTDIVNQEEFYDASFADLKLEKTKLQNKIFENCRFINCNFSETQFISCKFVDCEFKSCNLSSAQFDNSSFSEVVFYESKAIGINWTKLKWPSIKLSSPFQFYKSNISHSSFYGLDLLEVVIKECKAYEVDFRDADFTGANFSLTDFERSLFMHTKLYSADFSDAINYNIDPNENDIRKAKFTMPDVINLLHAFDIEIDGDDYDNYRN